eukprot:m.713093 g.713093  ORF g.713093 m.713093 type:complete len:513 (+) comp22969_c0_seq7:259-1797(+)
MSVFDVFIESGDDTDGECNEEPVYLPNHSRAQTAPTNPSTDSHSSLTEKSPLKSVASGAMPSLFPTHPNQHAFGEYILDGGRADTFGASSKITRIKPGVSLAEKKNAKQQQKQKKKRKKKGAKVEQKNAKAASDLTAQDTSTRNSSKGTGSEKPSLPPPQYICKICNIPGHFIYMCPQKSKKKSRKSNKAKASGDNSVHNRRAPPRKIVKQDCIFWAKGSCQNGSKCMFSHDKEPDCGKVVCKYHISGSCMKGDACSYSHNLKLLPCRFFHRSVRGCQHGLLGGDACKFSHDPLTPATTAYLDEQEQAELADTRMPTDVPDADTTAPVLRPWADEDETPPQETDTAAPLLRPWADNDDAPLSAPAIDEATKPQSNQPAVEEARPTDDLTALSVYGNTWAVPSSSQAPTHGLLQPPRRAHAMVTADLHPEFTAGTESTYSEPDATGVPQTKRKREADDNAARSTPAYNAAVSTYFEPPARSAEMCISAELQSKRAREGDVTATQTLPGISMAG